MTRPFVALLAIVMVCGFVSGCSNTFEGAGRDVENAGEWIQDTF